MATTFLVHPHEQPEDRPRGIAAGMRVVIPVRYSRYIQVLLWSWLAAWALVETAAVFVTLGAFRNLKPLPPQPPALPLALLGVFTAAGLFIAWRLLWVVRGREILDLAPTIVRFRRRPFGLVTRDYERSKMRNVRVESYKTDAVYPSWGRQFLGKGECFIAFDYEGRRVEIARGLEPKDAAYVADLIRTSGDRLIS